ncbi:hypothetical protein AB0T83_11005 [Fluviibacterium sp. DFM31]|uniref:Uncharacterized protein n=1 Tax=Meridianimarinicoccus marinus TaxID=3231483 RepID=A0ABV3LA93_9RHOB
MSYDPSLIAPMPDEEVARLKSQIERRWRSKPHYEFDPQGADEYGSPCCVMRAHEILRLIARIELPSDTELDRPVPKGA